MKALDEYILTELIITGESSFFVVGIFQSLEGEIEIRRRKSSEGYALIRCYGTLKR